MNQSKTQKIILPTKEWNPESVLTQYSCMVSVLEKHHQYQKHEKKTLYTQLRKKSHRLRQECRDGNIRLKTALYDNNTKQLRNLLINHRDMQRLYQRMPSHLVVENIDQRTFVMKKERDRLRSRLNHLTSKYNERLLTKAGLEDRIKYENEFVLDEEVHAKKVRKLIENSHTRLRAIKTIRIAYDRMIQLLMQDAIYYDPVINSLKADIKEQSNFIKHVISIGTPVIGRLQDLTEEYKKRTDMNKKVITQKIQWLNQNRTQVAKLGDDLKKIVKKGMDVKVDEKRYARETKPMLLLKDELEKIQATIKLMKTTTLCSRTFEIYPTMKKLTEDNVRLKNEIVFHIEECNLLEEKKQIAAATKESLKHNLTDEEILRLETIKDLKESIKKEKVKQEKQVSRMREQAEVMVNLRYAFWNIGNILSAVGRSKRMMTSKYPTEELKLPLLNFDTFAVRVYPPEMFEEDLNKLLETAQTKVKELVAFAPKVSLSPEEEDATRNEYAKAFLETSQLVDDF